MKILFAIAIFGCLVAHSQDVSDLGLAHLLANDSTRRAAISAVVESRLDMVPTLLSWMRTPPRELNDINLYILHASMAEIFGRLKTKEAIPFLIENIAQRSSLMITANIWRKSPAAIEEQMPAIFALIQIGRPAFEAIIRSPVEPITIENWLARVFVVSRIGAALNDPSASEQARIFVGSALGEANLVHFWAEEGLKHLLAGR
jgi:hypothetical protein